MTGNAFKGSYVGQAVRAVQRAGTITKCHGETDTIFCKKY